MDQAVRNKLRGVVTQCRKLLEDSVSQELQGKFGIYAARKDDVQVDDEARMSAQRAKSAENEPPLAPSAAADVKEPTIHAGDAPPVGGEADHGDEGSANRHAASDPEKV